ncbi:CheR family methyltransferase [Mucilaginibacter gotjawali]|uniref:Chemotaxis protein methyltransferase Cher2 n=2 Tax=Mucilaginibacter gotjawali TaxID=1550579 RepID=A0A0X8X373_9SPHI|nr:protein-glutamate O-methyltransferase CheR [Mucilaginibacter gotjawali]MBB3058169.1 chemotaxis protein methyltransferase CheR [Mucilaginibacter gotjawali]BAU54876.1 Chemotaxis protein methyltransferase Cher2 [Mucilaginibacter gotjawali]
MEFLISDEQIELLLNDLIDTYGYDFTAYTKASLKRRINRLYTLDNFPSFAEFRYRIRSDETYFTHFIEQVTVNVTEMFRDPAFFKFLSAGVLPVLATYPFIRIWHAGCSTGEEVFSMAILLKEAGLLHKTLIYATDINPAVVKKAAQGIFPIQQMQKNSDNYRLAGGKEDFSSYYTAGYNQVIFDKELSKRLVFSTHNLVSESSFNHFQLIVCRNVLIYFEKELQGKVFQLFDDSLDKLGYIALGSKETMRIFPGVSRFRQEGKEKIWRKIS